MTDEQYANTDAWPGPVEMHGPVADTDQEYRLILWGQGPLLDPTDDDFASHLRHFIGDCAAHEAEVEVRLTPGDIWRDLDDLSSPPHRDRPDLTRDQVAMLVAGQPSGDNPYAEPLHFLALDPDRFWRRAVLAGWLPPQRDLDLMRRAHALLAKPSNTGDEAVIKDGAVLPPDSVEPFTCFLHARFVVVPEDGSPASVRLQYQCMVDHPCHDQDWQDDGLQEAPEPHWMPHLHFAADIAAKAAELALGDWTVIEAHTDGDHAVGALTARSPTGRLFAHRLDEHARWPLLVEYRQSWKEPRGYDQTPTEPACVLIYGGAPFYLSRELPTSRLDDAPDGDGAIRMPHLPVEPRPDHAG